MSAEEPARASVIIPAHNEEAVICRLLDALEPHGANGFDVVVVCNGCTDGTADVVRRTFPTVRVFETPTASKRAALDLGDAVAVSHPRIYVDADVVIDAVGIERLVAAVGRDGVLAAAPRRVLELAGASLLVRSYYQVWQRLPAVAGGLYGRGVVALSREGVERLGARPEVLGDDLLAHHTFTGAERRVVAEAVSRVWVPRRTGDLVRRRARAAFGNRELGQARGGDVDTTSSSLRHVLGLWRTDPAALPHVPAFLLVTALARLRAARMSRAGDRPTWLRDDSSRALPAEGDAG